MGEYDKKIKKNQELYKKRLTLDQINLNIMKEGKKMIKHLNTSCVFILDKKGSARSLSLETFQKKRTLPKNYWVHINLSEKEGNKWLRDKAGLDPEIFRLLSFTKHSRPRSLIEQNHLLLVLRTPNLAPRSEPDDLVFLRLWANESRLITTGTHPAIHFDSLEKQFNNKEGPKNIAELLITILDNVIMSTTNIVNDIEDKVDDLEEAIISKKASLSAYDDLSEILRQVVGIRRYLVPEREAIWNLSHKKARWFDHALEEGISNSFYRIERLIEDLDLQERRVRINQDVLTTEATKKTQKNLYMLSILAGLFLPLSFLASLFGMNVGGIPFSTEKYGLLAIVGLMILVVLICLYFFKKLKWL